MVHIEQKWRALLRSTEAADRARAEAAVARVFRDLGSDPPRYILWRNSPLEASLTAGMLEFSGVFGGGGGAMAELTQRSDPGADAVARCGRSLLRQGLFDTPPLPAGFQPSGRRYGSPSYLETKYGQLFARGPAHPGERDPELLAMRTRLDREGDQFRGEGRRDLLGDFASRNGLAGATAHLGEGGASYFTIGFLARAEWLASQGSDRWAALMPLVELSALCDDWWIFQDAIVLLERPLKMVLDETGLPGSATGPAITYRDGTEIHAWEGGSVPAEWFLRPETLTRKLVEVKQGSRLGRAAMAIYGPERYKAEQKLLAGSALLNEELPLESSARIAFLRDRQAALPLYDRYMAGEHEAVWDELVKLGPKVRQNPYAADALAVAYETMSRARANAETIAARLKSMGYKFAAGKKAILPLPSKAAKRIKSIEKGSGPVPLSLRAWWAVGGEVDFTGSHPKLCPPGVYSDPLVVYGLQSAEQELGGEGEGLATVTISMCDSIKAGEDDGGDAYDIELEPVADGIVHSFPGGLTLVGYLRFAFRHGGFPGFADPRFASRRPAEIDALAADLLPL